MKKLAVLLAGAMLMMATSAWAIPYVTLTKSQLLSATQVSFNALNAPVITVSSLPNNKYPAMTGVGFSGSLSRLDDNGFGVTGPASSTIAVSAGTLGLSDLSSYDAFRLSIANYNNSNWDIALFIEAADGDKYYSSTNTLINNNVFTDFSIDLTTLGADRSNVKFMGFVVSSMLPGNPSDPDAFHIAAAPVPEPGTMVLLGFGMLGLAIYGKRRMNKES